ncbi:hypothetical protein [Sulfuricurvum sp.]|uniref:hypothetical protein n=1 Tax=Sulfuricurvum sp. TaxID=2025608 RepID=UPI003C5FAF1F
MKILIIDQRGFQLQTRKMLLEEAFEETVESASALGDVFMAYQKGVYDVVIIDHGIENGQQCVDHILEIDPQQQILVVSTAIHCVVTRCQDCVDNHQMRRLFNPTPIKNIIRMVEGFRGYACDHYDPETNKIKV